MRDYLGAILRVRAKAISYQRVPNIAKRIRLNNSNSIVELVRVSEDFSGVSSVSCSAPADYSNCAITGVPVLIPMVNTTVTGSVRPVKSTSRAHRLEFEIVVAEGHNMNVQAYAVDDPHKRKSSRSLLEGARRNLVREAADLQGHVLRDRFNPKAGRTQAEVFRQIEAVRRNIELSEGRGERHQRGSSH